MAGDGTASFHRTLQCSFTSPGLARWLVGDALAAAGVSELEDSAKLLVSEAVTNAVVHASTQVGLRACYSAGRLRVEIEDGSLRAPALPGQPGGAWGRGVLLLDALADRWGVERWQSTKVVWFELLRGRNPHVAAAGLRSVAADPPCVEVTLSALPTSLTLEMVAQDESMLREIALVNLSGPATGTASGPSGTSGEALPAAWDSVALDLGDLALAANDAVAEDSPVFDAMLTLPAGAAQHARTRLELTEEGDRQAAAGLLLCQPASREVADYRRWLLGEIASRAEQAPETGAPG